MRLSLIRRHHLPFEPMALSQYDRMLSLVAGNEKSASFTKEHSFPPFFVSPKLDGVRLVSCPNISASADHKSVMGSLASNTMPPSETCFSRYGRPVRHLVWIEQELELLRLMSGDPMLILDGELYIHAQHLPKKDHMSSSVEYSGFLFVTSLINRLRGNESIGKWTMKNILDHVPVLPNYLIFDVISYQPPPFLTMLCSMNEAESKNFFLSSLSSSDPKYGSLTMNQWRLIIIRHILHKNGIKDANFLTVIPNVTPFTQRLRTLNFLFQLLHVTVSWFPQIPFISWNPYAFFYDHNPNHLSDIPRVFLPQVWTNKTTKGAQGCSPTLANLSIHEKGKWGITEKKVNSIVNLLVPGKPMGGRFIQLVQYEAIKNLPDAKNILLKDVLNKNFEGVVVRTALNTCRIKEKKSGALTEMLRSTLVARIAKAQHILRQYRKQIGKGVGYSNDSELQTMVPSQDASTTIKQEGKMGAQKMLSHSKHPTVVIMEEDNNLHSPFVSSYQSKVEYFCSQLEEFLSVIKQPSSDDTRPVNCLSTDNVTKIEKNTELLPLALDSGKKYGTRSTTAAKILPCLDTEFQILRALVKKKDTKGEKSQDSSEKVFYGLQCITSSGHIFNVQLPNGLSTRSREELYSKLTSVVPAANKEVRSEREGTEMDCRAPHTQAIHKKKTIWLTGLYVTLKYPSLTKYGVPRFAQVKAIRGSKGYFL